MALTVRPFLEALATHGLLSAAEVDALRALPAAADPDADAEPLAKLLVQEGKLTKFQAANLYQGRGRGLVFGEYLVVDRLGAGGQGQVYKARHRRMKRTVALKVLPPSAVHSSKAVQRFYQEVEVAAKLIHPNIVHAYDAGEAHGMQYLVMEFVDGRDLSSFIARHGPLGVEQGLNVVLQAARGLAYAHGLGIVHRDIKPSNLLVDRTGVVKILDMGLARIDDPLAEQGPQGAELTAAGEVMGTVDYMAPEQAQDTRAADHRADIYALGCTLYRLLVGRPPYGGETTVQKILAHRDQPIPSLAAARGDVPEVVDGLFQKMLAKNPADRTPSMAQVVSTLERLLAGVDEEKSSVVVGADPIDEHGAGQAGLAGLAGIPAIGSPVAAGGSASGSTGGSASGSGTPNSPFAVTTTPKGQVTKGEPTKGPPTKAQAATAQAATVPAGRTNGNAGHGGASSESGKSKRNKLIAVAAVVGVLVVGGGAWMILARPDGSSTVAVTGGDASSAPAAGDGSGGAATPIGATPIAVTPGATSRGTSPRAVPNFPEISEGDAGAFFGVKTSGMGSPSASATSTAAVSITPANTPTTPETPPPAMPAATAAPAAGPSTGAGASSGAAAPPPAGPPPAKPGPPLTEEVDLLAKIEPEKTALGGTWERIGTDIVCKAHATGQSRVLVPFDMPEEYDLTASFDSQPAGAQLGIGVVAGGRAATWLCDGAKGGLGLLDGKDWFTDDNPTVRYERWTTGGKRTVRWGVRRNRVFAYAGDLPLFDYGEPGKLLPYGPFELPPGAMHLHGYAGARFSELRIAPPTLSPPVFVAPAAVNLAARFDPAKNVVEGEAAARRNEIIISRLPNRYGRVSFNVDRPEEYVVTAVVERQGGGDFLGIGLPLGRGQRTGVMIDWGLEKVTGLQQLPTGPATTNPTARRAGMLLVPGMTHVVRIEVTKDPKGWRVRTAVDGRSLIDYAGADMVEGTETQVPDLNGISINTYNAGWRIVRFELAPAGGKRLPAPKPEELTKGLDGLRSILSQAAVKGAKADAKSLAVDNLRREAALRTSEPAVRFAALDEALRLAVDVGDLEAAFETAEEMNRAFDVDPRGAQKRVIEAFKFARPTPAAKQELLESVLDLSTRAAAAEQWALEADLLAAMEKNPAAASNADVRRELRARAAECALAQELEPAAREAEESTTPDAAAHEAIGRYRCFGLGDWAGGLKDLTHSAEPALKAAADAEAADPKDADEQVAVGERWWELSEKEKNPTLKWVLAERAAVWYRAAAPAAAVQAATKGNGKSKATIDRRKGLLAQQRKASGGAGAARRPLDAQKIGDHWYAFYGVDMDWRYAALSCRRWGGALVQIDTPQENQAIAALALGKAGNVENVSYWMGASDREKEGEFRWPDGTPVPTTNNPSWYPGQPDNGGGTEDVGYVNAALVSNMPTIYWYDTTEAQGNIFVICEWDH